MSISIRPATLMYKNFDDHIFHIIRTFLNGKPKSLYDKVLLQLKFNLAAKELFDACDIQENEGVEVPIELYKKAYIARDKYFYDIERLKTHLMFTLNKLDMCRCLTYDQKNIMSEAIKKCDLSMFYSQYDIDCYVMDDL